MYERVGEKHLSRREFLVRGAAFGVATTGLGSLISACGYGGAAGSGADLAPAATGRGTRLLEVRRTMTHSSFRPAAQRSRD